MAKVKLLVGRAGPYFSQRAGETIEVGDAEARRLIASQQAVAVTDQRETALPAAGETRTAAKPRKPLKPGTAAG